MTLAQKNTHWNNVPEDYFEYEGFIYCITNLITSQKYIGRKYFFVKKKSKVLRESDWQFYMSSSDLVKSEIAKYGKSNFQFDMISVHRNRQDTNYAEVEAQIKSDVLKALLPDGKEAFYNRNILSRYFKPADFGTPEYIAKCSNISASLKKAYASGAIVHGMAGKVHPNKGKKLPQTGHKKLLGKIRITDGDKSIVINKSDPIPEGWKRGMAKRPDNKKKPPKQYENVCESCTELFKTSCKTTKFCSSSCQQIVHSARMRKRYIDGLVPLNNHDKGITDGPTTSS